MTNPKQWALYRYLYLYLAMPLLFVFSILPVFTAPTHAAPAQTLNFQGRLLGIDGGLVSDGFYDIEFRLYENNSGGSSLWTETWNTGTTQVRIANGYFSVYLGTHTSFPALDWTDDKFLTMNVEGDGEMGPDRFKLTAVPYAFAAQQASELIASDSGFTTNVTIDTPTQNNSITLPNESGEVCLTSGNCAGTGGTGDILDGGQAGAISIGTTNATTLTLLQNNNAALTVNSGQLLQFNAYNCSTFANGGTLTTDASGNVICADDDGGGGGGGGVTALNTLTGGLTLSGGTAITITDNTTDTITVAVTDNSIGNTQLAFDTGQDLTITSAPQFATINTGNGAMEVNTIAAYLGNQNLRTTDSPTFADLTITSTLTIGTTVLSEADLDALDDGVIALGVETSGTYDNNPSDDLITSTNFGGDISGTYNSISLGSNVVGSTNILNGSILEADLNVTNAPTGLDNYILSFNEAGGNFTWVPQVIDTNTTYNVLANQGLQLSGTNFGLIDCAANEILKRNGADTQWVCATDIDMNTDT